jgi:3-hydroxyacyl-CoA dehydrogenase/enoyl-CoA hydratase/3-hydroxybutyryl-CoA epimerase
MIFGAGFAPFRGGPMHYLKERGRDRVAERLSDLAARFGSAYRSDPGFANIPLE